MQDCHMPRGFFGFIGLMRPRVESWRFGWPCKSKTSTTPSHTVLALEYFFDGHTLNVRGSHAMQAVNHVD